MDIINHINEYRKDVCMKQKYAILAALLMMILLSMNSVSAFGYNNQGHLDSICGNTISGWAWNYASPESSPQVSIRITRPGNPDIVKELTATANTYRNDLKALGIGTGSYGFQAIIDWSELEDGIYFVDAYCNDQKLVNTLQYKKGNLEAFAVTTGPRSLGTYKTTAYCPCRHCCGKWGTHTSSGTVPTANRTIAVDPDVIPYGSKVMIRGNVYIAEDSGGGVDGNHIDIFFNSHREARKYGVQQVEVFLIE